MEENELQLNKKLSRLKKENKELSGQLRDVNSNMREIIAAKNEGIMQDNYLR